jgi:uncharacterized protein
MLQSIFDKFHNSRNITEKRRLIPILDQIREFGYTNSKIFASFGEDSAAIRPSPESDELILLTTDAIIPEFIDASPWGAGFSAIYVGIDDIMACGGDPLACSVTVAYEDSDKGKEILRGIIDATNVFRVPLIRGHTTTDASNYSLSSTIIGKCQISQFISAGAAKIGEYLAVVWDPEGHPAKLNAQYWDSITMKNSDQFYQKRSFIKPAIKNKYITSCKDISNGGILGTLYQMMEYSKKGARFNLEIIENHINSKDLIYNLTEFIFLYFTSAFLITGPKENQEQLELLVKKSNMVFCEVGEVISEPKIVLIDKEAEKLLIEY